MVYHIDVYITLLYSYCYYDKKTENDYWSIAQQNSKTSVELLTNSIL